jgi:zinc transport system ATP-binding protein
MHHGMTTAVRIENLSFSYDHLPILSGVNLQIEAGRLVGVIGPNGGGKTTLFRLILGFLKPKEGAIWIYDRPPVQARDQMAYVPQELQFDRQFPISALEVVLAGRLRRSSWVGRYPKADKEAALAALHRVGLEEMAHAPFSALSGGQAQRTLIARALVSNPTLLLLDEPTANVDAKAESEIYALLHDLKGTATILLVTHDFQVATQIVDDVIFVQRRIDRLAKEQVCEHFSWGVYHHPIGGPKESP